MLAVAAQAIAAGVNKSDPGYEFNECLKDVVGAFEDTISSHAKARLEMADRDADQTDKEENPILDGKGNVVDFPGKDDNGGGEPLAEG